MPSTIQVDKNSPTHIKKYWEDPEKYRAIALKSYRKNREKRIAYNQERYRRLRLEAYEHYGGAICACCGETELLFLTIDHINGGGNEHRRSEGNKGSYICVWLKKNNYPEGFQVLCYNCNCGKARNKEICPHQDQNVQLAP